MAKIASYPCLDFSGGIRRDKGPGIIQKNEVLDARNVHLNERGRLRTRLGSQQLGQTLTGEIENSFFFAKVGSGTRRTVQTLVNNRASTGVVSVLKGTFLTAAVALGDTTLTVDDTTQLTASGTLEIEGDLIAYTATPSGTSITGVTGITSAHASGLPVQQWATLTQSGTAINATQGITYAVLNNICFFGGRVANLKQYDGATVTDVSGEPALSLLTTYRDRLYGVGDSSASTNGDTRRVSFSARGDGTSWTPASDYFTVEDQAGQPITCLKVHSDTLGIFKLTKIYTYNEIELKQRIADVGAYSHKVVKEIDGKLYTFCPNGVFVTNLYSSKSIGEPVQEYLDNFSPIYDETNSNSVLVLNTSAWVSHKSYFLYIGDITSPVTMNDVVLEYNTVSNAWTVHQGGYTDFEHVNAFAEGRFGGSSNPLGALDTKVIQRPVIIAGDTGGKVWRLEENKFRNVSQATVGSSIYVDLRSDTGTPISASIETQMYDLTHPELFKKFKRLRVLTESGQWNLEYRVEDESGITPYRTLGSVSTTNKVLPFPSEAQGWACGFRISGVNENGTAVFNGVIFEDTEVVPRP